MKNDNSKLSFITKEKKKEVIDSIIAYYSRERGEEIGVIAVEDILDFILDQVADDIFNRGVDDTLKYVQERANQTWNDVIAIVRK